MNNLNVLWAPDAGTPTSFPCVDCGLRTGNFCDGGISVAYDQCHATDRVPHDYANTGGLGIQRTPLCSYCETRFEFCRFCRGVASCTPPSRKSHWSRVPLHLSRDFDERQAKLAVSKEFVRRAEVANKRAESADQ